MQPACFILLTLDEIRAADRKFLAKGTCGEVFKGKFRGQIIAIKCLIGQEEADTSAHSHKTNNTFTNLRRDFFHVRIRDAPGAISPSPHKQPHCRRGPLEAF
jgi:hypothetical protein